MSEAARAREAERQRRNWEALPKDREGYIQQKMGKKEWEEKAKALAALSTERADLAEKKTESARDFSAKIAVIDEQLARLVEEVDSGEAWVEEQGSLPVD